MVALMVTLMVALKVAPITVKVAYTIDCFYHKISLTVNLDFPDC